MIEEAIRIVSGQAAERNITIEDSVSDKLEVEADRRAIKQILLNLLSNAVKFTNDGGHVQIRARQRMGYFTVSIEDDGIGISKSRLEKAGTPLRAGAEPVHKVAYRVGSWACNLAFTGGAAWRRIKNMVGKRKWNHCFHSAAYSATKLKRGFAGSCLIRFPCQLGARITLV